MNKTILLFVSLAFIMLKSNAQENKLLKIDGAVKYNSSYLQDINILNKSTNLGSSSDENGRFSV